MDGYNFVIFLKVFYGYCGWHEKWRNVQNSQAKLASNTQNEMNVFYQQNNGNHLLE